MSYNPSVPASGQSLGETLTPIQTNFTNLDTAFSANHTALTTSTAGKHEFLQMPEQSSDPTVASNEGGLYVKELDSSSNLAYRSESSGQVYQLTSVDDANIATFGTSGSGWTFLPGGLVMQYGLVSSPGTSGTVTYDRTFSAAAYSITLTSTSGNTTIASTAAGSFNYAISTSGVTTLYWMAIGPQ